MEDTRLQSFPFDSKASGYDDYGYPLYDRAVGASMLKQTLAQFFTNGVFTDPLSALVITKGEGLRVVVSEGVAIINGAIMSVPEGGISVKLTDDATTKGTYAYGVFLRCDDNTDKRSCYITVRTGDAGPSPTPPEPERTAPGIWELRLGYVVVPTGASDLSGATVYDERGTDDVCPYASPFVKIDVGSMIANYEALFEVEYEKYLGYVNQYIELLASAVDGTTAGLLQERMVAVELKVDEMEKTLNGYNGILKDATGVE